MKKTLRYDYKKPIAPSKAFQHPISLSKISPADIAPLGHWVRQREAETAQTNKEEAVDAAIDLSVIHPTVLEFKSHKTCGGCGNLIEESAAIWYVTLCVTQCGPDAIDSVSALRLCQSCGVAQGQRNEWLSGLRDYERQVYRLKKGGLKQAEIARKLVPRKSQAQVSRILGRLQMLERKARKDWLRRTGGA